MKVITREEVIYHAGPEAVVKIFCELSAQVVRLTEKQDLLEERVKILEEEFYSVDLSRPSSDKNHFIRQQMTSQKLIS